MALTFTLGAGLIIKGGEAATTRLLLGILGCNIVWGIVDGAMYVINSLLERSRKARLSSPFSERRAIAYEQP